MRHYRAVDKDLLPTLVGLYPRYGDRRCLPGLVVLVSVLGPVAAQLGPW